MTFFFNLSVLESETKNDPSLIVEKLRLHFTKKSIPKHYLTKIKPISNLVGNSFLVNPADLFADKTTDIIYKSQYIQLAGRRDYSSYKLYNINYLDLSYFKDIDISKIITNPLLTITENKIHFKYEDIKNGN
jgi:hypothetical protein